MVENNMGRRDADDAQKGLLQDLVRGRLQPTPSDFAKHNFKRSGASLPSEMAGAQQLLGELVSAYDDKKAPREGDGGKRGGLAEAGKRKHQLGPSELTISPDGKTEDGKAKDKIDEIKLPTGQKVTRDASGKYTSTNSEGKPGDVVNGVAFDQSQKGFHIDWARKNGIKDDTYVRPSGVEEVYDKPKSASKTVLGVPNAHTAEYQVGKDGNAILHVRDYNQRLHSWPVLSKPGDQLRVDGEHRTELPPPSAWTKDDLSRGASEVSRLIHKANKFLPQDQDYYRNAVRRYEELGNPNFIRDVNAAGGKDLRYRLASYGAGLSLQDRKNDYKQVDSLEMIPPKKGKPRREDF